MTKSMRGIINKYGIEKVIAMLMEQIRLLSERNEVSHAVAGVVKGYSSDTEYIYSLCEYTNLITYTSENPTLNDFPWEDREAQKELDRYAKTRYGCTEAGIHLFPVKRGHRK